MDELMPCLLLLQNGVLFLQSHAPLFQGRRRFSFGQLADGEWHTD